MSCATPPAGRRVRGDNKSAPAPVSAGRGHGTDVEASARSERYPSPAPFAAPPVRSPGALNHEEHDMSTTTTAPTLSTLAQRVNDQLAAEDDTLVAAGHNGPKVTDGMTMFELDLIDWGMTLGIAYAIARAEDPFESVRSVTARAVTAARDAYAKWGEGSLFDGTAYAQDRRDRPASPQEVSP